MMTSREFLSLLFGHPSLSGLKLVIWDRQTAHADAFTLPEIDGAVASAAARANTKDVYFGTCPYTWVGPGSRGLADNAGALVGVWLDVDVRDRTAHKAENLPETREEAFDFLYGDLDKKPSAVVSSGYGLQAWWLFREPWMLHDAADRIEAAQVSVGWVNVANKKAAKYGWHFDPVGDLARIMRLPETWNRKGAEPRRVEVVK